MPIAGTLAESCLRNRGIDGALPRSLRFLPQARHMESGTNWPALVAAVREYPGIETELSVLAATGIPTWAALSAGGIENLILPTLPLASKVIICADHDPRGLGAAGRAAGRWVAEGRDVRVAVPPEPGCDFNYLHLTSSAPERGSWAAKISALRSQRDKVIAVGLEAELWRYGDFNAYATVEVQGHLEHCPLRDRMFRPRLLQRFS